MVPSDRGFLGQLRTFYVRRCRRILPALLVMLLASTAVACWLFLPSDLLRFGTHLSFTSGFISNFAVWREGGYFDLNSPFNPLLHLWSIAVEEQFYLGFPLIFLASGRALKGGPRILLTGAALLSFAVCVWASYHKPIANFFLVPTRAWELLLGSLVALGLGHSLSTHAARDALAGAALLAMLGCVVWYDDSMRYPGLYALVPCVGAAILLATARNSPSRVGRWMSARPLVFTGLISYSLYLWHVPILAFAGYYNVRPLEPWHLAILLPSIYVVSAASWRYVEAPVRGRRLLVSDSRFLRTAGGATIVIGSLGLIMWLSEGSAGTFGGGRRDVDPQPRSFAAGRGGLCSPAAEHDRGRVAVSLRTGAPAPGRTSWYGATAMRLRCCRRTSASRRLAMCACMRPRVPLVARCSMRRAMPKTPARPASLRRLQPSRGPSNRRDRSRHGDLERLLDVPRSGHRGDDRRRAGTRLAAVPACVRAHPTGDRCRGAEGLRDRRRSDARVCDAVCVCNGAQAWHRSRRSSRCRHPKRRCSTTSSTSISPSCGGVMLYARGSEGGALHGAKLRDRYRRRTIRLSGQQPSLDRGSGARRQLARGVLRCDRVTQRIDDHSWSLDRGIPQRGHYRRYRLHPRRARE